LSPDGRLVQIPFKLYRFRTFNDRSLAGLTNRELFFSAPERFNDPFDSQFDLIDEDADRLERIARIRSLESRGLAPLGSARKAESLYDQPGYAFERPDETPRDEYRRRRDEFRLILSQLGIACFSEPPDSILMWSHYSEQHKGFCLEFSDLRNHLPADVSFQQVYYRKDMPSLSVARRAWADLERILQANQGKSFAELAEILRRAESSARLAAAGLVVTEAIASKHTNWAYEREWRAIVKRPNCVIQYSPQALTTVIFGMRAPIDQRKAISKALTGPEWAHVQFAEAVRVPNRFAVSIETVPRSDLS
jgi:Protein of unknown function (DUF2971)